VKAFLATASSSNVCTSEILDSSTVRVRGRFDSNASLRGPLKCDESMCSRIVRICIKTWSSNMGKMKNEGERSYNFFSISAAVLKSFASTAVSIRATSSL